MAVTAEQLNEMSPTELDNLFKTSPAGDIPVGKGRGTAIVNPEHRLGGILAKFIHFFVWKGKVFDPVRGELKNEITFLGLDRIKARVYREDSWFDGHECIVLDYSKTSLLAKKIRDEMREVDPGVYLGLVFWNRTRFLYFALEFPQG
jgi:hypothetical protein